MWKNREDYLQYHRARYNEKRGVLNELRSRPCTDCGGTFPYYVMEFDHVPERGKKKYNITDGASAKKDFLEELAKCDLVCANCHTIRTWTRRNAAVVQR